MSDLTTGLALGLICGVCIGFGIAAACVGASMAREWRSREKRMEGVVAGESATSTVRDVVADVPRGSGRTRLVRRLLEIRARIVASGAPLLSGKEIADAESPQRYIPVGPGPDKKGWHDGPETDER